MNNILVRHMSFEFSDLDTDSMIWINNEPERSNLGTALSLIFPYLEPYLVKTLRTSLSQIDNDKLKQDITQFCKQETQHYSQHQKFNALVHKKYSITQALEEEVKADYAHFLKNKSLAFNLAYAEGFEAMTTALARFVYDYNILESTKDPLGSIFKWHLVEEVEHRSVAFDAYHSIKKNHAWLYKTVVALYAQYHLIKFVLRAGYKLSQAQGPEITQRYGGKRKKLLRWTKLISIALKGFIPKILFTYLPGYNPNKLHINPGLLDLIKTRQCGCDGIKSCIC